MRGLADPQSAFARTKAGALMLQDPLGAALGKLVGALAGDEDSRSAMAAVNADSWKYQLGLVEKYNRPGTFTSFAAYEWTAMWTGNVNMHRNVIFRDKAPEVPYTAAELKNPEDLWAFLEAQRAKGIEGLAIPHNMNASNGMMFDWNMSNGRPIDEAYARTRAMNEPLAEVYQHKGQSETSPLISPADEFADFERAEELLGSGGPSKPDGSFARQALGRGLVIESKVGANPFKLGFVAASDFHNGLSDSAENAYAGNSLFSTDPRVNLPDLEFARRILSQKPDAARGQIEGFQQQRVVGVQQAQPAQLNWSGAGLTGVWAEANTRDAIYAALRRKETFATSGTQMRLRMFGGWNLPANMQRSADWVRGAYRLGVPMGSDLPGLQGPRGTPEFLFEAAKDPSGANLDRIQVVKVWLEGDDYKEKIFEVAWSSERRLDREDRETAGGAEHRRSRDRALQQFGGHADADRPVARSRIRSEETGGLLCPRARNSDAALDDTARRSAQIAAAAGRSRDDPGAGGKLADLVHPAAEKEVTAGHGTGGAQDRSGKFGDARADFGGGRTADPRGRLWRGKHAARGHRGRAQAFAGALLFHHDRRLVAGVVPAGRGAERCDARRSARRARPDARAVGVFRRHQPHRDHA